jgi:hypothetical protein
MPKILTMPNQPDESDKLYREMRDKIMDILSPYEGTRLQAEALTFVLAYYMFWSHILVGGQLNNLDKKKYCNFVNEAVNHQLEEMEALASSWIEQGTAGLTAKKLYEMIKFGFSEE